MDIHVISINSKARFSVDLRDVFLEEVLECFSSRLPPFWLPFDCLWLSFFVFVCILLAPFSFLLVPESGPWRWILAGAHWILTPGHHLSPSLAQYLMVWHGFSERFWSFLGVLGTYPFWCQLGTYSFDKHVFCLLSISGVEFVMYGNRVSSSSSSSSLTRPLHISYIDLCSRKE